VAEQAVADDQVLIEADPVHGRLRGGRHRRVDLYAGHLPVS
jgi:hypothetical protein